MMLNSLKSSALALREALAPAAPRESAFLATGQLTPEEFERAGDQLAAAYPVWHWRAAERGLERAQHPVAKQFLLCSGVACLARVADGDNAGGAGGILVEAGGWLVSARGEMSRSGADGAGPGGGSSGEEVDLASASASPPAPAPTPLRTPAPEEDEEGDGGEEFADMASFVGKSLSLRIDAAAAAPPVPAAAAAAAAPRPRPSSLGGVVQCRTYDVSISFDRHYRVPRLWLRGAEGGAALGAAAMMADVQRDHAERTVTVELHPLAPAELGPCLSLHPCRHAAALKSIVDALEGDVDPADALIVFLKFASSVVPTIAFDSTRSVRAAKATASARGAAVGGQGGGGGSGACANGGNADGVAAIIAAGAGGGTAGGAGCVAE